MGRRRRFRFALAGLALGLGVAIALLRVEPCSEAESPAVPRSAVSAARAYDDRPVLCGRPGAVLCERPVPSSATTWELLTAVADDGDVAIADERNGTPSELLAILADGAKGTLARSRAALALGQVRPIDDPIRAGLRRALGDPDAKVAAAALEGLSTFGADVEGLIPTLLAVLEDPEQANDQPKAALVLGTIGRRAEVVLPALMRWGATRDARWAVTAVARFGKAAMPWLGAALADDDDRRQSMALTVLEQVGPEGASLAPRLIRLADESARYGRVWRVSGVVAGMGPAAKAVVPDVVRIVLSLEDADPLLPLWMHLLPALGPDGEAALWKLVDTGGPEVRMSACAHLAARFGGSPQIRSRLERLAHDDPDENVRNRALRVLHRLDAR